VRGIDLRGLLDLPEQPLPELARRVLAIPIQRRRERRVIPVRLRRLLLPELRLRSDIRAKECLVAVFVGRRRLLILDRCQLRLLPQGLRTLPFSSLSCGKERIGRFVVRLKRLRAQAEQGSRRFGRHEDRGWRPAYPPSANVTNLMTLPTTISSHNPSPFACGRPAAGRPTSSSVRPTAAV